MNINFNSIGTIYTPFNQKEGMPIQSTGAKGVKGKIILKSEYLDGLLALDGFSHIILIYYFHKSVGYELQTAPFLDNEKKGIFATRAPKRPNSIGISVVKLLNIDGVVLNIENIDTLNETPLLDIKPYIPDFDIHEVDSVGWIKNRT
ncbi:tRNA (N6-threonylcarbamoyladenosine(37)-N6)-methyltransferase TrmO, partial [bacterium]|nr:tRNA (N6-threonylcarbamoyladenosine(37)-N6)-methyltransferase TrmO [bacterium]